MAYHVTDFVLVQHLKAALERAKAFFASKAEHNALAEKVTALEVTGGQANVIEGVKVNGTALSIAEKMVDILIASGTENGTISVNGADVAVKGLAALAYKSEISEAELSAALKAVIDAKAEASAVTALQTSVTALIGEDTGKSARTIANEELAKQLIPENATEALDTLAEIAAWIQEHPEDASAMNKAIGDLTALVGTLPEGATATNIVDYIGEVLAGYYTKNEIDTKFSGYSNTEQMNAAIKVVDDKFSGYSTTEQMNTAIDAAIPDDMLTGEVATEEEITEMLDEVFAAN